MAVEFLERCDAFQLPLFAMFILCGLRASEPCWLMREHLSGDGWLKVVSLPDLGYTTKGRRDKRFPLPKCLHQMLHDPHFTAQADAGLILRRRSAWEGSDCPEPSPSLEQLKQCYKVQCSKLTNPGARRKQQIRDGILKEAGALNYDRIEHEFRRVVRGLDWPASATLKDFRHLFSTELMNAGVPDYYRKYLMGQSVPNVALTSYTHLNELEQWYCDAIHKRFGPVTEAIKLRANQLKES
jgi:integrase